MQVEIKNNKIYIPLMDKWVKLTPEQKLKQEFICRLVNVYGYNLKQLGQDVEIKKRYRADIAIWRSEIDRQLHVVPSIIITVECKAEHIRIKESDYSIGYNFASTINANFFIAVNQKESKIFHIQKNLLPKKTEKLSDIPRAEILVDDKKIEKYIRETKSFTREEFTKLLSRCHNIIRNNDKLSPEAAFDEISKVLFMKIMYERNAKEEMIFSKAKFQADEKNYEQIIRPNLRNEALSFDLDYMQYLFNNTKRTFESDGLFDIKDQIKIKRNSFEMIVEELETFNLSDTSDDVKGIAFEQFLGKTFRGELGQFFTPRTIVDYMVEILDPKENEIICDPCCGSGGFLITAFEYVRNKIDDGIKDEISQIHNKFRKDFYFDLSIEEQNKLDVEMQSEIDIVMKEFDMSNKSGRYYKLSHDCIFGTDANPRMARTAKMNMIMHGDGHGGVHHHDGLLNINGIFNNRFDIIFTNPPFGARVEESLKITEQDRYSDAKMIAKYTGVYGAEYVEALKQVNDNVGNSVLSLFELSRLSSLTEVIFLDRCLNLLKPGGRMGIVLPEGVMNNGGMQKIREYVQGRAKILNITSIPKDVFISSGATIKPSILFLQKLTDKEKLVIAPYEIPLFLIENAGITSNGILSEKNQFPHAINEYFNFLKKNEIDNESKTVRIVKSNDLINWSVSHNFNSAFNNDQSKYPNISLSKFLKRNRNTIKISDDELYKRITIRNNNRGIVLRDEVIGSKIGTKRQFVISKGQFAISKIDARNGAMGIIPEDLENAVVTPDFLTYNINEDLISPTYLELIITTESFVDFCRKFSSGSTNRQRLNEVLFLNAKIPLPSIEVQKKMVEEITNLKSVISEAELKLNLAKKQFSDNIF